MAELIDGKKIANEIFDNLRNEVQKLKGKNVTPLLKVILVGSDPASLSYIKIKKKRAEQVGIKLEVNEYPDSANAADLKREIEVFGQSSAVHGIIVQLPLPPGVDRETVLGAIPPELDVDCLTEMNRQKLTSGTEPFFYPPAAAAILHILDLYHLGLEKMHILLVGSGELVGKPLAIMLSRRKVHASLANRQTRNLRELSLRSDVLISGVGKAKLITGDMVKSGAVVIDAGTTGSESGDVQGDVDVATVGVKARLLAPVPGGVGPVTVAMLLQNVVRSASRGFDSK